MEITSRAELEPFTTKDGSTIREMMHTERQSLAEATLAPRQATERHYHRLAEELYAFTAGGGVLEVDGEERIVREGDTVLIPAGAWHRFVAGAEGGALLCCCVPPYSHDDTYFD